MGGRNRCDTEGCVGLSGSEDVEGKREIQCFIQTYDPFRRIESPVISVFLIEIVENSLISCQTVAVSRRIQPLDSLL